MQMLYLKHGQTNEMDNLQTIYKTWVLERKSLDTFYEHINEHMKSVPPSSTNIESTTKNLLAIRQQLIKDFETRAFKTKSLDSYISKSLQQSFVSRKILSVLQYTCTFTSC